MNLPSLVLETRMLPQCQHDTCERRFFKLTLIYTSVIHQILWICWIHWIFMPFRENSTGAELSLNSVISVNSSNLINHWSMTWFQFKEPVSDMCLAGSVVASWSLTQEMAGSSPFNEKYFCQWIRSLNSVKTFRKNSSLTLNLKWIKTP